MRGAGGSDDEATLHPMTEAHFVSDIYLLDGGGKVIGIKHFSADNAAASRPIAEFVVSSGVKTVTPVE